MRSCRSAAAGPSDAIRPFLRTHFLVPGFWEAKFPTHFPEGIKGMPEPEAEKLPGAHKPYQAHASGSIKSTQHPALLGRKKLGPLPQGPPDYASRRGQRPQPRCGQPGRRGQPHCRRLTGPLLEE